MIQTVTQEKYTIGYGTYAEAFMAHRSAAIHAAFFLPHLKPQFRLLDCGCGPGTISRDLARIVSEGELIGIDQEISQLKLAVQRIDREQILNARFQQGSVYEILFDSGSFDAVFSHALMEHLSDPAGAVAEMFRVLKPGGIIGIRSPDWGGFLHHPSTPGTELALRIFQNLQKAGGGDVHVGRRLPGLLLDAGFEDVQPSGTLEFCRPVTYMTRFLAGRIREAADKSEIMHHSDQEISDALSGLRELEENPGGNFAIAWCEVVARKSK